MPCPFPGMDPFLEMPPYWSDFSPKLLTAISNSLLPRVLPRYDVRIEEYLIVTHDEQRLHRVQPDVTISTAADWNVEDGGAVAVAEPATVELDDVYVGRAGRRPRCQVLAWSLPAPLPTVPIPLLPEDADVPLDLQAAFRAAYEPALYERRLPYEEPLQPPLEAARERGLRRRLRNRAELAP